MQQYKTCTKCGQTLPLESFSPSKGALYGVRSKCKPCCAAAAKDYRKRNPEKVIAYGARYRQENPEKIAEHNRRFRESNPNYAKDYHAQHREAENLRGRLAYWQDPIKQAVRKKKARQENPEKFRERNRKYAANNRQKLNEKSARRRARKLEAPTYKLSQKEIWRLYNYACFYCGEAGGTIEHVMPLARGGSHGIGNLVPCCGPCNYSKADKTVMEWRIWKLRMASYSI
jgi:5-methylcytosine-specific restriction endonuclease McrA